MVTLARGSDAKRFDVTEVEPPGGFGGVISNGVSPSPRALKRREKCVCGDERMELGRRGVGGERVK